MSAVNPPTDGGPMHLLLPSAVQHIAAPHLSTHEDAQAYETLLAALRKDLQLDAATELQPGTYAALLNLGIDRGLAVFTWPGGSQFSNVITVSHRLPITPNYVDANPQLVGGGSAVQADWVAVTATTVQFRAHTTDGSSPVSTVQTSFYWIATI